MLAPRQYDLRDGLRPSEDRLSQQAFLARTSLTGFPQLDPGGQRFEPEVPSYQSFVRTYDPANDPIAAQPRLGAKEEVFAKLLQFWNLDAQAGAALLGYQASGVQQLEDILNAVAYFKTQDEFDRVAELFEIRRLLHGLLRDREAENQWLRQPQAVLGNRAPINLLLERHMEGVLRVRQFLETIAGL